MLQIKRAPQTHSVGKRSSGILYLIRVAYQKACFYRKKPFLFFSFLFFFFFLSGFSFTDTDDSQDSREREETIFYSTLPLPLAHKHWDIYLQLCMWDDKFACLPDCLTWETGGFELASTITFVLQANRLTKCYWYHC